MTKTSRQRVPVGADEIALRIVAPPTGCTALGSVLVPPLIGGSGMQQVGYFRELNRRGYRLITFDYRGHGKSGGRFSVSNTLADTAAALDATRARLGDEPLFGLADCYGSIPLLRAASARPGAFRALALFNPIPSLRHVAGPLEVLLDWLAPRAADGRRRLAARDPFDLRGMLLATNSRLFPHVDRSRDHFGILRYERAHPPRVALEYLFLRPLAGVVCTLPTRITIGRSDVLLRLDDPRAEQRYRALWRRHLPDCEVQVLEEADHYWTGVQARASEVAAEFFAAHARTETPLVAAPRYRAPRGASERNHQLGGFTMSSGLKRTFTR